MGRPPIGDRPMTAAERQRRRRAMSHNTSQKEPRNHEQETRTRLEARITDGRNLMAIDLEAVKREEEMWAATPQLRWFRPPGGSDNDIRLEQLYERVTYEREWRPVPTCLAD